MKVLTETREDLIRLFRGVGAEIGVERGLFSKKICTLNPFSSLYAIDPWEKCKGYREHVSQEMLNDFYDETIHRLSLLNVVVLRKTSLEAARDFAIESLDFVYIDANHDYTNCLIDIVTWASRVKSGGIVSGHDYVKPHNKKDAYGVIEAVNDYCKIAGIKDLVIYAGDKSPSWMFIKP